MNQINFNQVGGFPLSTNILAKLQTAFSIFNALGNIVGELTIISGCEVAGDNVGNGVVYINGEVLEFRGGLAQTKVIIKEDTENLTFQNGNSYPSIKTRYVTFGTGVGAINWVDFKRGFPTKNIPAAFAGKVDNTTLDAVILRIDELEKKNAVFQTDGGMILWNKPANLIPDGWAEVVNWRGRMPIGWNPDDANLDTVGETGGAKTAVVSIPVSGYGVGADSGGNPSGQLLVSSGAAENGEFLESVKKASSAPVGATVNHMNPYRVVLFIEYIE
ncbi:hypothetical protein [Flavobacterium algoritolerans]|uniref:Tail fiber protein n=1 Tax=Flavobacterium algoritolerans TaxID=3041254 RepID=A0ABT6V894_9FLAO|nr:hypothetical protein [Flavobacterium algoritolerans]MDI5894407.1 hypothetical protein [Flavobacterium algoritolerans]